jgi:hypothetical protein
VYLGDSVYADFDGYHIVLTTQNGYGPTNTIYLEPSVHDALNQYALNLYANRIGDRKQAGEEREAG